MFRVKKKDKILFALGYEYDAVCGSSSYKDNDNVLSLFGVNSVTLG